jgi:hypothetical protein
MRKMKRFGCGLILSLLGVISIVGIYAGIQIFILPDETEVSSTLSRLYEADQEVRTGGIENPADIVRFLAGDWLRVNKVRRIVAADMLTTGPDYANAARILQHGGGATDYLKAQELSLKAYELGVEEMLRHSALAEDRYLLAIGEPQKYGSQFSCEPGRGWQLEAVDPSVTDEERLQVNIDPLAEMEVKMEELNQLTDRQCSLTQETMRQVEAIMAGTP